MHRAPLISTIIPCYNAAPTIERTLRSVQAQTETDIEIIVVNDGSTDHAPQIVDAFAARDHRIRRIDQHNRGLPAARNTGIGSARATHLHFLDADDTIDPHAYEKLLRALTRAKTGAAVAGHDVRTMDNRVMDVNLINRALVNLDDLVDRAGFVCHAPLVSRAAIGTLRFDESFRSYEDLDFWFRLGETGLAWAVVNEPLVHYAMRHASMSSNVSVMLETAQRAVANLFDRQLALRRDKRLIDASPDRRDRRLTHFALSYATQTVILRGIDAVDDAIDLFANARGHKRITPEQAAEKTLHAFTYILARPYDDDLDRDPEHFRPLDEFWRRCVERRWAETGLENAARLHLRRIRHEHDMVATAILDHLNGATSITIIGLGKNGSTLARLAAARALNVTARDDRFDTQHPPDALSPDTPDIEPMTAPLRPDEPVIISPLDDRTLTPRFAHAQTLIRWRQVRQDLFNPQPLPT